MNETLTQKAAGYLNDLCVKIGDRSVRSSGNVKATEFFEKTVSLFGWETEKEELDVMDWECGTASLYINGESFAVEPSPYSSGCLVEAELVCISDIKKLESADLDKKAVLLYGDIAGEQLMPKNFSFYNPAHHRHIVSLLEKSGACVFICATGRNPALAGGVYPFPMIEDGDFNIPSVYMKDKEGEKLALYEGERVRVHSPAERISSKAYNLTSLKRRPGSRRIVITAHIDAKKGTAGAMDNATGVVTLLLLAELLSDYSGNCQVELVPFNGEDYYAIPGQMAFLKKNRGRLSEITLNINIDGAGYFDGDSAFSFYGVPEKLRGIIMEILAGYEGVSTGPEWPQGDHSIFFQHGIPAIAVSSLWFTNSMESQDITHTEKDRPEIVDINKIVQVSWIISDIVKKISDFS